MKKRRLILSEMLIIVSAFIFNACPQTTDPESPVDPEITGFTFTATENLKVDETAVSGAVAGTFSEPAGGTAPFVYELIDGDGIADAHNPLFVIDGVQLKVGEIAVTIGGDLSAYVQIRDSKNKTFAKAVIIPVESDRSVTGFTFTAVNGLIANSENTGAGAVAGTFSAPVGGVAPFTYSLGDGNGTNDADNGKFVVSGNDLKIAEALPDIRIYRVYLCITDNKGQTFAKAGTINVNAGKTRTLSLTTSGFTPATVVSTNTARAQASISGGNVVLSSGYNTGDFTVYVYDSAHYEIVVTGLSVASGGEFSGTPSESVKSDYPVYNSSDTAGGSVFDAISGKTSGTYLLCGAPTRPAVDENGKSDWGIPAGVTLVLMDGSTWHMHTQYNYTGLGTFKYEATSGNATMLPGGTPPAPYTFQVSTLEIGGTLWLVGGIERIYGAMTSPGGIVRLPGGTRLLTGASGSETVTVTDTAPHGGAYWHVIVKNLVVGSSTLTIKDAITFAAVTVTENATYGSNAFTMDSSALGLGNSGGSLVVNAPGKTVTVKSIDCENGKLANITVTAGTLDVTDADGITNTTGTTITVSSGASLTIADIEYEP